MSPIPARARWTEPPLKVLAAILLAVFMASRLSYFWYYPSVRMALDSAGYLDVVKVIREGHWPHFIFRTPGYPLFFWFVTLFTGRWMAVICLQSVLSFASCLFLVHAVRRFRPSLALPATLALCGFLGSSQVVLYDIALLSDSLYSSCLIVSAALLFLAFRDLSPAYLALASTMMVFSILTRPAGIYLVVVYAVVLLFLLWNRVPGRSVAAFLVPFPALLLGFCTYNYATISSFVITPFGEANLAGATALFWEPDPRLPDAVNRSLAELPGSYEREGITPADFVVLRNSWDPDLLFPIYAKAYNRMVWSEGWGSGARFAAGDYLKSRGYIKQVSLIAIRRHPALYAKYVWVNMVEFFRGVGYTFDIESSLAYREKGNPLSRVNSPSLSEEGMHVSPIPAQPARAAAAAEIPESPGLERSVKKLQHAWQDLHGMIFQNLLWSWAYFVMLVLSAVQLVRSRGRHLGAFILFVLTLIPLGASLVVCLVETATDRYSYPTQFIYYLAVALCPLLWGPSLPAEEGRDRVPQPSPTSRARNP